MRSVRLVAVALLTICLFVAVIAVSRHAHATWTGSDGALIELYTIYAVRGVQAVGAYSRFGWHHPGPVLFYLLAPFYLSGGSTAVALSAGATWINLVSMLAVAWALYRASNAPALGVAILAVAGIYVLRAHAVLSSAWNPHILVFPFIAFMVASALLAAGNFRLLPVLALLASFLVQMHVGVVPVVFSVGFASLALLAISLRRSDWRQLRLWTALTTLVAALLWALPLAEERTHTPGNLTLLWRYFVSGHGTGQTTPTAIRAWADLLLGAVRTDFHVAQGWLFQPSRDGWPIVAAVAEIAALAVTAFWAWNQKQRLLFSFATTGLVASIISCWAITRIRGDIADHDIFWISALGALNLGVICGATGSWLIRRPPRYGKGMLLTAAIGFAMLCSGEAFSELVDVERSSYVNQGEGKAVQEITQQLQRALSEFKIRKPFVRVDFETWGIASGVLLELYKSGIPFSVEKSAMIFFERPLASSGDEDAELTVCGQTLHRALAAVPEYTTIAKYEGIFVDSVKFREDDPRRITDR